MSVPNFKKRFCQMINEFYPSRASGSNDRFIFLKFETPRDCRSHHTYCVRCRPAQITIAGRHLPCSCGNLDNRSNQVLVTATTGLKISPVVALVVIISYLKISSSSWKTEKKSYKGALKLEVPKMPKVEEFYPPRASRREPLGRTILFIIKD